MAARKEACSPEGGIPAQAEAAERRAVQEARLRKYGARAARVWGYIGIGVVAAVVCLALGTIWDALTVLFLGALMAFIYAPIVNWLDRRFRVPRLLGTFVGLIALFAVVTLFFLALVPPLTDQFRNLLSALPAYVDGIQDAWTSVITYLDGLDPAVQERIGSVISEVTSYIEKLGGTLASTVGNGLVKGISGTVSGVVSAFMAIVVSFWLAKDFPRMEHEISTIVGPRIGEDYRIVTSVFGRSLGGYLKGLVITSTCTGTIAGVGFWILGIPYSGLLGLVTAVLNVIPYIGPWVGGALGFLVGLTVGWAPALFSIMVTVVAQQFTDTFVSPKVMQEAVSVHPALVIIALLAGGSVGGVVGMILAVPLTAAVKGVFVYYFEKKTGRQLVGPDGAIFRGERFCDDAGNPRPACDALGVDIEGEEGVPPRIKAQLDRERAAAVETEAEADEGAVQDDDSTGLAAPEGVPAGCVRPSKDAD